jgi:hypothetical protein
VSEETEDTIYDVMVEAGCSALQEHFLSLEDSAEHAAIVVAVYQKMREARKRVV